MASVKLPLDEARHLLRVMRLRIGAPVRVFSGRGLECAGRVAAVDRDEVTIDVQGPAEAAAEARTAVTLAQALLKGDCMDGVIRDAVMLGVTAVVPILSAHVEGDRRSHAAGLRLARWERIAVASAKQCGRAVVPSISPPLSLAACLSAVPAGLRVALVEPASPLPVDSLHALAGRHPPGEACLFIGPEGGWAEEELRLLAGYDAVGITLGRRTLRAESAALVGLAALRTVWGEFD
jgi:16S rRNA (uracil1498-N3)-methyltransferase